MFLAEYFVQIAVALAMLMMIWDCFEVGRNDAANLVNAVFGARVMKRKKAVLIAGAFVILGATFSSPVMDTVRKGIFDPEVLTISSVIAIFLSAYIVDTVLLYIFSAYGMPVSTTATLIFCLTGGAIGVSEGLSIVSWATLGKVLIAIILSIITSGIAGFLIQRIVRGALGRKNSTLKILLHGPWVAGGMITGLLWFMVMKGLKGVSVVKAFRKEVFDVYGESFLLLCIWATLSVLIFVILRTWLKNREYLLFHFTAMLGMICMAFAFGQNDLANAASPGLASFFIWQQDGMAGSVDIPRWALFGCGVLIFLGMTTKNAQRVTRAEVNVGSQHDKVALYAPRWALVVARFWVGKKGQQSEVLAPEPSRDDRNKKVHYDPIRASVILAVCASVIAFASGMGLPVSTTYVAFAAVVASGWGDRVFSGGDGDIKIARAIWVVCCWFLGGLLALVCCMLVAAVINNLQVIGIAIALGANFFLRYLYKKKADLHDDIFHKQKQRVEV